MLYLFEDQHIQNLKPITTTRLACDIPVAGQTLFEFLTDLEYEPKVLSDRQNLMHEVDNESIFINSSLVPDKQVEEIIKMLIQSEVSQSIWHERKLLAAKPHFSGRYSYQYLENFAHSSQSKKEFDLPYLKTPFDTIILHQKYFREYITKLTTSTKTTLHKTAILDETNGPIILGDNVTVEAYSILKGPLYIGDNSTIKPHSMIEDSVIGHTCKIGGEIEASIIGNYTNKQHYGFLGHSFVGDWVNIGGGTSNSDLKNTYGTVRVKIDDEVIDTGEQFLGCIIGDYAKTAVNTSIYTGKMIGAFSSVMGDVDTNVDSGIMQMGNKYEKWKVESIIETQRRMFERRGIEQSNEDIQMIYELFS